MHILILPSFYPTQENPNYGSFFYEQASHLQEAGLQVGVIHPEVRPFKALTLPLLQKNYFQISETVERGMNTFRSHGWNLSPGFLPGTMHLFVKCADKLFQRYVKRHGVPGLIHAHCTVWGGVTAHHLAKKYGIPFLITEHRSEFLHSQLISKKIYLPYLEKKVRETLSEASACVAVSSTLKSALERYTESIKVIPNFLDLKEFNPSNEEKPKDFTFFSLSNLVPKKNIQLLIRAFEQVCKKDPSVKLKIGGDGVERKALQQMVKDRNLSRVEFLGKLSRSQVKEAMASSHVFVLPSLVETFGIVFIEALAMGLPVIGTQCGGPEDIITEKVGRLIACDDLEALVEGMQSVKEKYSSYDANHLRSYVEENFSKEKITNCYIELYKAIKGENLSVFPLNC